MMARLSVGGEHQVEAGALIEAGEAAILAGGQGLQVGIGDLIPRGFFLGLGLMYLAALALDRLAACGRLPGAAAVLLLGLSLPDA